MTNGFTVLPILTTVVEETSAATSSHTSLNDIDMSDILYYREKLHTLLYNSR